MRDRRYSSTALWRGQRERLKYAGLLAAIGTALVVQPAKAEEAAATTDAKSGTAVLAPINVQANTENEGPLGPVIQQDSSTATKTDTPIKDIPRSISVETRQQMTDKGALRLEDTFDYTAGMRGSNYGVDARGNWGTVRGFSPATYLDGLQFGNDGYYNDTLPEIDMLERVEILKGPASALYGMSAVGGIVNAVSKRPQEETSRRVTVEYGTNNRKQATLDMTGKIDEDGKILGRFVGLIRDSDTQVNYGKDDAGLLMPSITFRPDTDTDITVIGRYEKTKITPEIQFLSLYGTLLPGPDGKYLDTDTFVGEPGFDKLNATTRALTVDGRRRLDDVWTIKGTMRYSASSALYNHAYWGYDNYPTRYTGAGEADRTFYSREGATYFWLGDLNATADFETGAVRHKLLLGANYSHIKVDSDYGSVDNTLPIDPYDPVYTGAPAITIKDNPSFLFKQTGFYAQDQMTILDRIVVDAGLRWDKFDSGNAYAEYGGETNAEDHDVTWNAGLLYKFDSGISPYASYAESFLQESYDVDYTGAAFKPTHGEQYEAGVKYQPPGTSSLFTAAVFDLTKSNMLVTDYEHSGFSKQTGETKSRGIEFEAQTRIEDFFIDANYSFVQTRDADGRTVQTVPKHQASAWVTWRPENFWTGFKAGAGIRYVGPSYGYHYDENWTLYRLTVPSFTLGDAMIGYETPDWDITLNARNITDEIYVAAAEGNGGYYGARRTVVLKFGYNF